MEPCDCCTSSHCDIQVTSTPWAADGPDSLVEILFAELGETSLNWFDELTESYLTRQGNASTLSADGSAVWSPCPRGGLFTVHDGTSPDVVTPETSILSPSDSCRNSRCFDTTCSGTRSSHSFEQLGTDQCGIRWTSAMATPITSGFSSKTTPQDGSPDTAVTYSDDVKQKGFHRKLFSPVGMPSADDSLLLRLLDTCSDRNTTVELEGTLISEGACESSLLTSVNGLEWRARENISYGSITGAVSLSDVDGDDSVASNKNTDQVAAGQIGCTGFPGDVEENLVDSLSAVEIENECTFVHENVSQISTDDIVSVTIPAKLHGTKCHDSEASSVTIPAKLHGTKCQDTEASSVTIPAELHGTKCQDTEGSNLLRSNLNESRSHIEAVLSAIFTSQDSPRQLDPVTVASNLDHSQEQNIKSTTADFDNSFTKEDDFSNLDHSQEQNIKSTTADFDNSFTKEDDFSNLDHSQEQNIKSTTADFDNSFTKEDDFSNLDHSQEQNNKSTTADFDNSFTKEDDFSMITDFYSRRQGQEKSGVPNRDASNQKGEMENADVIISSRHTQGTVIRQLSDQNSAQDLPNVSETTVIELSEMTQKSKDTEQTKEMMRLSRKRQRVGEESCQNKRQLLNGEIADHDFTVNKDMASEVADHDFTVNEDMASEVADHDFTVNKDMASEVADHDFTVNEDMASEVADHDFTVNKDMASEVADHDVTVNEDMASEVADHDFTVNKDMASEVQNLTRDMFSSCVKKSEVGTGKADSNRKATALRSILRDPDKLKGLARKRVRFSSQLVTVKDLLNTKLAKRVKSGPGLRQPITGTTHSVAETLGGVSKCGPKGSLMAGNKIGLDISDISWESNSSFEDLSSSQLEHEFPERGVLNIFSATDSRTSSQTEDYYQTNQRADVAFQGSQKANLCSSLLQDELNLKSADSSVDDQFAEELNLKSADSSVDDQFAEELNLKSADSSLVDHQFEDEGPGPYSFDDSFEISPTFSSQVLRSSQTEVGKIMPGAASTCISNINAGNLSKTLSECSSGCERLTEIYESSIPSSSGHLDCGHEGDLLADGRCHSVGSVGDFSLEDGDDEEVCAAAFQAENVDQQMSGNQNLLSVMVFPALTVMEDTKQNSLIETFVRDMKSPAYDQPSSPVTSRDDLAVATSSFTNSSSLLLMISAASSQQASADLCSLEKCQMPASSVSLTAASTPSSVLTTPSVQSSTTATSKCLATPPVQSSTPATSKCLTTPPVQSSTNATSKCLEASLVQSSTTATSKCLAAPSSDSIHLKTKTQPEDRSLTRILGSKHKKFVYPSSQQIVGECLNIKSDNSISVSSKTFSHPQTSPTLESSPGSETHALTTPRGRNLEQAPFLDALHFQGTTGQKQMIKFVEPREQAVLDVARDAGPPRKIPKLLGFAKFSDVFHTTVGRAMSDTSVEVNQFSRPPTSSAGTESSRNTNVKILGGALLGASRAHGSGCTGPLDAGEVITETVPSLEGNRECVSPLRSDDAFARRNNEHFSNVVSATGVQLRASPSLGPTGVQLRASPSLGPTGVQLRASPSLGPTGVQLRASPSLGPTGVQLRASPSLGPTGVQLRASPSVGPTGVQLPAIDSACDTRLRSSTSVGPTGVQLRASTSVGPTGVQLPAIDSACDTRLRSSPSLRPTGVQLRASTSVGPTSSKIVSNSRCKAEEELDMTSQMWIQSEFSQMLIAAPGDEAGGCKLEDKFSVGHGCSLKNEDTASKIGQTASIDKHRADWNNILDSSTSGGHVPEDDPCLLDRSSFRCSAGSINAEMFQLQSKLLEKSAINEDDKLEDDKLEDDKLEDQLANMLKGVKCQLTSRSKFVTPFVCEKIQGKEGCISHKKSDSTGHRSHQQQQKSDSTGHRSQQQQQKSDSTGHQIAARSGRCSKLTEFDQFLEQVGSCADEGDGSSYRSKDESCAIDVPKRARTGDHSAELVGMSSSVDVPQHTSGAAGSGRDKYSSCSESNTVEQVQGLHPEAGFSTASGTSIIVSEQARSQALKLIQATVKATQDEGLINGGYQKEEESPQLVETDSVSAVSSLLPAEASSSRNTLENRGFSTAGRKLIGESGILVGSEQFTLGSFSGDIKPARLSMISGRECPDVKSLICSNADPDCNTDSNVPCSVNKMVDLVDANVGKLVHNSDRRYKGFLPFKPHKIQRAGGADKAQGEDLKERVGDGQGDTLTCRYKQDTVRKLPADVIKHGLDPDTVATDTRRVISDGGKLTDDWEDDSSFTDLVMLMDGGKPEDVGDGCKDGDVGDSCRDGGKSGDVGDGCRDGGSPCDVGDGCKDFCSPGDVGDGCKDAGKPGDVGDGCKDGGKPGAFGDGCKNVCSPGDVGDSCRDNSSHVDVFCGGKGTSGCSAVGHKLEPGEDIVCEHSEKDVVETQCLGNNNRVSRNSKHLVNKVDSDGTVPCVSGIESNVSSTVTFCNRSRTEEVRGDKTVQNIRQGSGEIDYNDNGDETRVDAILTRSIDCHPSPSHWAATSDGLVPDHQERVVSGSPDTRMFGPSRVASCTSKRTIPSISVTKFSSSPDTRVQGSPDSNTSVDPLTYSCPNRKVGHGTERVACDRHVRLETEISNAVESTVVSYGQTCLSEVCLNSAGHASANKGCVCLNSAGHASANKGCVCLNSAGHASANKGCVCLNSAGHASTKGCVSTSTQHLSPKVSPAVTTLCDPKLTPWDESLMLHKELGDADNNSTRASMPSGFSTASGLKVSVSEKAVRHARSFREESGGIQEVLPSRSFGFSTASGNSVSVSEKAVRHARSFLEESGGIQEVLPNRSFGFSTASGNSVSVSEKAVRHARSFLEEAGGIPEVLPSRSFGFSTASGNSVSVSEKALQHTRSFMDTDQVVDNGSSVLVRQSSGSPLGILQRPEQYTEPFKNPELETSVKFPVAYRTKVSEMANDSSFNVASESDLLAANEVQTASSNWLTTRAKKNIIVADSKSDNQIRHTSHQEAAVVSGISSATSSRTHLSRLGLQTPKHLSNAANDVFITTTSEHSEPSFAGPRKDESGNPWQAAVHSSGSTAISNDSQTGLVNKGFSSASGLAVSVSEKALREARLFLEDIDSNTVDVNRSPNVNSHLKGVSSIIQPQAPKKLSTSPPKGTSSMSTSDTLNLALEMKTRPELGSGYDSPASVEATFRSGSRPTVGRQFHTPLRSACEKLQFDRSKIKGRLLSAVTSGPPTPGQGLALPPASTSATTTSFRPPYKKAKTCDSAPIANSSNTITDSSSSSISSHSKCLISKPSFVPPSSMSVSTPTSQLHQVMGSSEKTSAFAHRNQQSHTKTSYCHPEEKTSALAQRNQQSHTKTSHCHPGEKTSALAQRNQQSHTKTSHCHPGEKASALAQRNQQSHTKTSHCHPGEKASALAQRNQQSHTKTSHCHPGEKASALAQRNQQSHTKTSHCHPGEKASPEFMGELDDEEENRLLCQDFNVVSPNLQDVAASRETYFQGSDKSEDTLKSAKADAFLKVASVAPADGKGSFVVQELAAFKHTCDGAINADIENVLCDTTLEEARMRQEKVIRNKKKERVRPQVGRWLESRKRRKGLTTFLSLGLTPKTDLTREELEALGVSGSTLDISAANAGHFRFDLRRFYPVVESGLLVGDGAFLVPDRGGCAGAEEFYRAFLTLAGVDPSLVDLPWVENHYRWLVWKLAAYEVCFPHQFAGRSLTPELLMLQLKYRYDREADACQRSAIKKIVERDDTPHRRLVLCVAAARRLTDGQFSVELTDGWYPIPAQFDNCLTELVTRKRLRPGDKIITSGAELIGCPDGCSPLELKEGTLLKLNGNSTRPTSWHSKLGYCSPATGLCVPLGSLSPLGGPASCIDVVVCRKYPVMFMERLPEGACIFRTAEEEDKARQRHEDQRQVQLERIYMSLQKEMEDNMTRYKPAGGRRSKKDVETLWTGQDLATALEEAANPEELQESFSASQMDRLMRYRQAEMDRQQQEMSNRLHEAMEETCSPRNVAPVQKFKVSGCCRSDVDGRISCLMAVWQPATEWLEVEEGRRYKFFSVSVSSNRARSETSKVALTANRQTRIQPCPISENLLDIVYEQREAWSVSELLSGCPLGDEFDFVGVVIEVVAAARPSNPTCVYVADKNQDMLCIKLWSGSKGTCLKPGQCFVASNLMLSKSPQYSGSRSALVTAEARSDLTSFSTSGHSGRYSDTFSQVQSLGKSPSSLSDLQAQVRAHFLPSSTGLELPPNVATRLEDYHEDFPDEIVRLIFTPMSQASSLHQIDSTSRQKTPRTWQPDSAVTASISGSGPSADSINQSSFQHAPVLEKSSNEASSVEPAMDIAVRNAGGDGLIAQHVPVDLQRRTLPLKAAIAGNSHEEKDNSGSSERESGRDAGNLCSSEVMAKRKSMLRNKMSKLLAYECPSKLALIPYSRSPACGREFVSPSTKKL